MAEHLESRNLLATLLGGSWAVAYGSRISYSFAPDGTNVGGRPSTLSQGLAERGISETQWKNAFRRAAATWSTVAQINLVEVTDLGTPFGAPGFQQGDPRFGDIRIFGYSDSEGYLGSAMLPPPFNGGTAAGDIVMNTNHFWNINSTVDLQTVAIHEIGHALGLGHSEIASAVMYDFYNGVKQSLTTDDIGGIRSIYGDRVPDYFDTVGNNFDPFRAANLTPWINGAGKLSLFQLELTSNQDVDWYYVQAPSNASGTMKITMQSTGLSSLSPRFHVYNSALQLAGWTVSPNAANTFGSTISMTFSGVTPGTGVYFAALGWNGSASGVNGIGHYALQIDFSNTGVPPAGPYPTIVSERPNQGGGFIYMSEELYEGGEAIPYSFPYLSPSVNGEAPIAVYDGYSVPYTAPSNGLGVHAFPHASFDIVGMVNQLRSSTGPLQQQLMLQQSADSVLERSGTRIESEDTSTSNKRGGNLRFGKGPLGLEQGES